MNIKTGKEDKHWNKKSIKYENKYYAEDRWDMVEMVSTCEKDEKQ